MTEALLRIPPFPRHRGRALASPAGRLPPVLRGADGVDGAVLVALLRRWRVGGAFWGPAAILTEGRDVVLCPSRPAVLAALVAAADAAGLVGRAIVLGPSGRKAGLPCLAAPVDPWSLCRAAKIVIADADHEAALVASLAGCALHVVGEGRFSELRRPDRLPAVVARELMGRWHYADPYDGAPISCEEAVALLGRWRGAIDANRDNGMILGVARWKRITCDGLLWSGSGPVRHGRIGGPGAAPRAGSKILAWKARTDMESLRRLASRGVAIGEIEDGMIRSVGLGANCVPPLSIVVDRLGAHFDPAQASELELILQNVEIDPVLAKRAARLRQALVETGITKYARDDGGDAGQRAEGRGEPGNGPQGAGRRGRRVLVVGQVSDDRSVLCGGAGLDNLRLLRRTRRVEPEAWLVFKPHPDVEAGHRRGHLADADVLALADEIDRTASMPALLRQVDAVHVITSLAGFEGLLRGLEVVTHGVPFYAGWGLTRDLGPVPARRTRKRTLDELVAAALILYPRYVDPVTRLPCEPELVVRRIAQGQAAVRSPLIALREAQGRLRKWLGGSTRR